MRFFLALLLAAFPLGCSAGGSDSGLSSTATGGASQDAGETGGMGGGGGSGGTTFYDSGTGGTSTPPCTDSIDVVVVLDVSSSMRFVLDALSAEIDRVVVAADTLTQGVGADPPHFGLIPFVDNHVIDLGGTLEGGMVHLDAASLRAAFQFHLATFMTPNRNPGDGPTGLTMQNPICEENALDALHAAAVDFPWRPNATRVVIVATDDTFLERPDNYGDRDGDGLTDKLDFPREGDYPAQWTVTETVQALQSGLVRVFSFSARGDALHECGTGRRLPWEARSAGWSGPYFASDPIPGSTDGANFDLDGIRSGQISLSDTINDIVLSNHCNPPVY